jgi:hypothetical protein
LLLFHRWECAETQKKAEISTNYNELNKPNPKALDFREKINGRAREK